MVRQQERKKEYKTEKFNMTNKTINGLYNNYIIIFRHLATMLHRISVIVNTLEWHKKIIVRYGTRSSTERQIFYFAMPGQIIVMAVNKSLKPSLLC